MNLLGAKLYDPAAAVSKATSALLAMTAIDTANLRIAFTIPAHGMVRVRLKACLHGATTFPTVLLGVMNGAAVVGRVAPTQSLGNTAVATAMVGVEADFIVTGLAPGAVNWDAAYGVETVVAATGMKYGGPNNTTANDAFGGFCFEVWDPKPDPVNMGLLSIDASGRVDVAKVAGTVQTARDLGAQLDAAVSSRSTFAGGAVASVTGNVGGNVAGSVGSVTGLNVANLDAAVTSRLSSAGYTAPDNATIAAIAGFIDTEIGAIKAKTDNLPAAPAAVGSAMTLTVGERIAVANEVEAQIVDDTDSERVLVAITDKIAAANPSLGGLTIGAIASQVRTELAVELGRIDAAVSSVGGGGDPPGVTTLLERLTLLRAGKLDYLDASVSSRSTYDGNKTGYCNSRWQRLPLP